MYAIRSYYGGIARRAHLVEGAVEQRHEGGRLLTGGADDRNNFV